MKPTIIGTKYNLSKIKPNNPKLIQQFDAGLNGMYDIIETDEYVTVIANQFLGVSDDFINITKSSWEDVLSNKKNIEFVKYKIITNDVERNTNEILSIIESQ